MSTRTVLRVKRRRSQQTPSLIRLELLGGWNIQRPKDDDVDGMVEDSATGGTNAGSSNSSSDTQPHANGANCASGPPTERLLQQRSISTATNSSWNSATAATCSSTTVASSFAHKRKAAAVWKRIEQLPDSSSDLQLMEYAGGEDYRVVDAILEDDERSTKRRRLTVIGESTTSSRTDYRNYNNSMKPHPQRRKGQKGSATTRHAPPIHYRVLDPISRLVEDSLQMVQAGERSIASHYAFCTTDPRLASDARRWLGYVSSPTSSQQTGHGNLLHACAHWNDVEVAHDLLRQDLPGLAQAVDGEGRTPYEVAQLCQHIGVAEVMEAFGADTTNFVYDLFVQEYEHEREHEHEHKQAEDQNNPLVHRNDGAGHPQVLHPYSSFGDQTVVDGAPLLRPSRHIQHDELADAAAAAAMVDASRLLEIQGGEGYWTDDGELILEVDPSDMIMGVTAEMGTDDDYYGEDDIDSNCEDYGGNDYPDENECWEDDFLRDSAYNEQHDDFYGELFNDGDGDGDPGDIAGYHTAFLE